MKYIPTKLEANRGFVSTVELLIALSIGLIFITGSSMVLHNAQTAGLDTELTNGGLYRINTDTEDTVARFLGEWESPDNGESTDDVYNIATSTENISPCVKKISGGIDWTSEKKRELNSNLVTYVASPEEAKKLGNGCDPFPPEDDWDTPVSFGGLSSSYFEGQGTGLAISKINGENYAFLTTDSNNKENFYTIDTSGFDPDDNDSVSEDDIFSFKFGKNKGFNSVATNGNYAYTLYDDTQKQFFIIDISNPESAFVTASTTLPDVTNGIGRSIFYYDNKVYIGTQYVACPSCAPNQNNELHIYDVSDPYNPVWQGSINVDRNVNDIYVSGDYIYLATGQGSSSPYTPMKVYNVNTLSEVGSFESTLNVPGTSIFVSGDVLYLGLERKTTGNNFFVIDVSDRTSPEEISSVSLGENNSEVGDIVAQGDYVFIGLEGGNSQNDFQVWDVSDKNNIWRINPKTCNEAFPQNLSGIAFVSEVGINRKDAIFASFRSNEAFKIIYDTSDVCEY